MADKVSKIDKNGVVTDYSTYSAARAASGNNPGDHDLIRINADLTEQIILKDGVDIWILPGIVLNFGSSGITIVAPTTGEVNCKIYGQGIIKNDVVGNCIFIDNPAANISIECDLIEGIGGSSPVSVNIRKANKFHLTCNKVYNRDWQAIRFGETLNPGLIHDINLNITKVETGNITTTSPYTGTTAISSRGNGFIKIDEVLCRNVGHCLSHRVGTITAQIKKLATINNYTLNGSTGSTVHVRQYNHNTDTGNQKLILYFDSIQALGGEINSSTGIEIGEGTGIFIGRRAYSKDSAAIQIVGAATKGFVKCNELISQNVNAMVLNSFTDQITLDVNYIEGNLSGAVVYCNGQSNFIIKNAKIVNKNSDSPSRGIYLEADTQNLSPSVELNNVKIVSGNLESGEIIKYVELQDTYIKIKNFGLIANRPLDSSTELEIGTSANYQFVDSPDLT